MNGRFFRGVAVFPLLLLAALALPAGVYAQSAANSAQIVGVVVDPTQAAVANVPVIARNTSTNYERSVVTDAAGPLRVHAVAARSLRRAGQRAGIRGGDGSRSRSPWRASSPPIST